MADTLTLLAGRIAALERQVRDLSRSSRLANSSIENGAIAVYDDAGALRGSIGVQQDGTVALAAVNGPTPPVPSAPTVTSVLGGVGVSWDGTFADGSQAPADFASVEVHFSSSADFAADSLFSALHSASGSSMTVPVDGPVWVRLVCVSTSGVASGPSAVAGPAGPAEVVAQSVLDGIVTELALADGAVTAAKIEAGAVGSVALADGGVLEEHLHDAAVSVGKLANGAVTDLKLADDAVTAAKLATNSVDSTALQTGAVLEDKLHDLAVSLAKIQDNAVGAGKIAADAVTAREILAGSVTASEIAAGAISTDKLTVSGGANLLSDPSFEGPYTAALVAGSPWWSIAATGNGSAKSLKVDATAATASTRDMPLTTVPILPGDQLYVAYDYQASSNWAGAALKIYAAWLDSSGADISYSTVETTTPVLGPTWQRLSGTLTAPALAVKARIVCQSFQGTAGTVMWDNAAVRPVLPGTMIASGAITTAKMTAGTINGDRITAGTLDAAKIVGKSITAAQIFGGSITGTEIAAGTIAAANLAAGSITTDKLTVVGGSNLLSDPSFEGPYTAALVAAAGASWSVDATKGNGSPKSVKVSAVSAGATTRGLNLTTFSILPGEQLYLAVDYQCSSDWAGQAVKFYASWQDATGATFAWGVAQASPPVLGATWQRLTTTVTAPANTAKASITVETFQSTAGTVWWDNAAVRPVVGGVQIADGAITTPKMVAGTINGDRISAGTLNADRIVGQSITAAQIKALSITSDVIAADAITGKTITGGTITGATVTGAIVRTAASGRRLVMDPNGGPGTSGALLIYSGHASEVTPGQISSDVLDLGGGQLQPQTIVEAPYVSRGSATLRMNSPVQGVSGGTVRIEATDALDGTAYSFWDAAKDTNGTSRVVSYASNGSGGGGGFTNVEVRGSGLHIDANAKNLDFTELGGLVVDTGASVAGVLTAGSIVTGRVTITPSAANTPTSVVVTGLNVQGTIIRGFATASTTAPGTAVTGVGISSISSTGLTVWVTRTNTTATGVDWMLIAS
ncbi:hypothetical protein [Actinacidiphila soli]|uniref:hypothetical protein n=1 Tax=Actinacidiphila soli TaxID=2487275 RepID=UPI000FCB0A10|nr:hypothetical protein [Actinacidiphila soli]